LSELAPIIWAGSRTAVPSDGGLFLHLKVVANANISQEREVAIDHSCRSISTSLDYDFIIKPVYFDTNGTAAEGVRAMGFASTFDSELPVILGPDYSSVTAGSRTTTASFEIPLVSAYATSPTLSDKNLYPTFSRVIPNDALQGQAIAAFLRHFGWKRFAILSGVDDFESNLRESIVKSAAEVGIKNEASGSFDTEYKKDTFNLEDKLRYFQKRNCTIIVLAFIDRNDVFDETERVATSLNMTGDGYVWLDAGGQFSQNMHSGGFVVSP
jgi:hypothetical protein